MSAFLPNGTVYSIAATYGPAIPVTALTNAAPPVATAAAHGLVNGEILELTSGWVGLDGRPSRVSLSTAGTFGLEGYNTTNVQAYPALGGVGSVRKVLTWTQISQVLGNDSSGGEQQFVDWVYLEDGTQRRKPTYKNAKTLTLTLADDPSLAWNAILSAADFDGLPRILRAALPQGGAIYYNVYVGFDSEPKLTANQINAVTATFTSVGKLIRYAT
ncbi:phage tail protein [Variovorax boronicumulans]|nr:phage tail protein [Variovorax boronicumulans]